MRVLFVCVKNTSRSQMAEALMKMALPEVEVHSAGIHPGEMDRIFEPFFSTHTGGMGLGLAVCRSIIGAHGGRLWATNNEAAGASLHFTLPRGPSAPA